VTAKGPPIILVSGLPRSGSSMMMRMLEAGGVPILTDGVRKPDEDNPNGYYEFERAKRLNDDLSWVRDARGMAVKLLYCPVIYKLPADFQYKVIFMRRDLGEVVASQFAMLRRKGVSDLPADPAIIAAAYKTELEKAERWLASQSNFETLYIDYSQTVADKQGTCLRIKRFLGVALHEVGMEGAIVQSLYRQRHVGRGRRET